MRRIRETPALRAVLRQWAENPLDPRSRRAHDAYVSTEPIDDGFCLVVDDELLAELHQLVAVEEMAE